MKIIENKVKKSTLFENAIILRRQKRHNNIIKSFKFFIEMKKLVLFAGVLVAVSFASCGGDKSQAPAADANTTVAAPAAENTNCTQDCAKACEGDSSCCKKDSVKAACCGAEQAL